MPYVYKFINTQAGIEGILSSLMSKDAWGFDTETTGLDRHKDKVTMIQIGREDEGYIIDARGLAVEPLRPFFESKLIKKIGHNLKFEYEMMKTSFGIECEALRCTMLAEQILNAGKMFRNAMGLEATLDRRFGVQLDKEVRKTFIGHKGAFTKRQLEYGEDDTKYLVPLFQEQVKELTRDGLSRVYLIETNCIPAFGDMAVAGMPLDKERWKAVLEENISKQATVEKEMNQLISPFVSPDLFGNTYINYASPPQVLELMQLMRIRVPHLGADGKEVMQLIKKTDKNSLKKIRHIPFVNKLEEWRSYAVRINTFGMPYIDAVNPLTGAIHPDLWQIGTETGRPAAGGADINPLNVPSDNRYRHCFIGGPDEVVESDDYSGCESRILAHISGDPILTKIFLDGEDIHCAVASMMYGVPVTKDNENKKLRKPAKALNFGIAYGMGPKKLCEDLNAEGFNMSLDDAKKLYYNYCDKLEVSVGFLRSSGKLAAKQGYLANINGRRRYWRLPDPHAFKDGVRDEEYKKKIGAIEREGGNFLIQSVNADITKQAMIEIRDYAKANKVRTSFINAVYDEIVTRTHKDDNPSFHPVKLKIMRDVAERMVTSVPMLVDGFVGPYWNK
jgi:DNA polymerase I